MARTAWAPVKSVKRKTTGKGVKIQHKFQALGSGFGLGLVGLEFTFYALYPQPDRISEISDYVHMVAVHGQ